MINKIEPKNITNKDVNGLNITTKKLIVNIIKNSLNTFKIEIKYVEALVVPVKTFLIQSDVLFLNGINNFY